MARWKWDQVDFKDNHMWITRKAHNLWDKGRWCAEATFESCKLWRESTEYFGAIATTMTSLHNAYQFKVLLHLLPFGCNLKEFWDPLFWGLEDSVRALGLVLIESLPTTSQYHSIQSFALSVAIWPEFSECQISPSPLTHSTSSHLGGYVGPMGWKWSKCCPHIPIWLLYTL